MEQDQNKQIADRRSDEWFSLFTQGIERKNMATDRFNNLLVQIASIFLALGGVFGTNFVVNQGTTTIKVLFLVGLVALAISLMLGLINASYAADLWHNTTKDYNKCFKKWRDAREGKISNEEADQYCDGVTGGADHISSASWPWELQRWLLAIGLLTFLIVIFIVLF